jgi:hypothetical protein
MAEGRPLFYELLCEADKDTCDRLRRSLAAPSVQNQRNRSVERFSSIIDCIRALILGGDDGDRARSVVCGIYFLDNNAIGVNISQLGILTVKSKSLSRWATARSQLAPTRPESSSHTSHGSVATLGSSKSGLSGRRWPRQ